MSILKIFILLVVFLVIWRILEEVILALYWWVTVHFAQRKVQKATHPEPHPDTFLTEEELEELNWPDPPDLPLPAPGFCAGHHHCSVGEKSCE